MHSEEKGEDRKYEEGNAGEPELGNLCQRRQGNDAGDVEENEVSETEGTMERGLRCPLGSDSAVVAQVLQGVCIHHGGSLTITEGRMQGARSGSRRRKGGTEVEGQRRGALTTQCLERALGLANAGLRTDRYPPEHE